MSVGRVSTAVLLFVLLSVLTAASLPHRADYAVTVWLQHTLPPMDLPAGLLVTLGNAEVVIPAVALAGMVLLLRDRSRALRVLELAGGLAIMSLVAVVCKHVIVHPGPPHELQRHVVRGGLDLHQTPFSFPSGHTIRTTMIAWLLFPRRWGAGILVICMMTALVYLGDHWMTDVLGGLCLGWAGVEIARGIDDRRR